MIATVAEPAAHCTASQMRSIFYLTPKESTKRSAAIAGAENGEKGKYFFFSLLYEHI